MAVVPPTITPVGSGAVVGVIVGVGPAEVIGGTAKVRASVGTNILIISECNGEESLVIARGHSRDCWQLSPTLKSAIPFQLGGLKAPLQ